MVGVENPGIQALDVWRKLADFTPSIASQISNGAVPVVLHNITGRGTWISAGVITDDNETVTVSFNINGAGVQTFTYGPIGFGNDPAQNMPLFIGFETSLVVSMVLGAAGQAWFWSVAVVE